MVDDIYSKEGITLMSKKAQKKVWAIENKNTGSLVQDMITRGVTFDTRQKARSIKKRQSDKQELRVVPVKINKQHGCPRA